MPLHIFFIQPLIYSRAEIHQIFAGFFLENLRNKKGILKLTELYERRTEIWYWENKSASVNHLQRWVNVGSINILELPVCSKWNQIFSQNFQHFLNFEHLRVKTAAPKKLFYDGFHMKSSFFDSDLLGMIEFILNEIWF